DYAVTAPLYLMLTESRPGAKQLRMPLESYNRIRYITQATEKSRSEFFDRTHATEEAPNVTMDPSPTIAHERCRGCRRRHCPTWPDIVCAGRGAKAPRH